MAARLPSDTRQRQVAEAVLELLADTPVDRLSTRVIARRVGITQPGLFRHFRSREALVGAAVAVARQAIEDAAGRVVAEARTPRERLAGLVGAVLDHAARYPGLPRLLFAEAGDGPGAVRAADLRVLPRAVRALLAETVREAQARGEVPAEVDPELAGRLGLAVVQGVLLQWIVEGRADPLPPAQALVDTVWAGLAAGQPARRPASARAPGVEGDPGTAVVAVVPDTADRGPAPAEGGDPFPTVDVRPLLARGIEPLPALLRAVDELRGRRLLTVVAPFRPAPLIALLASRGLRVTPREPVPGCWEVESAAPGFPEVVDLRDLPAPGPLEAVLAATADLGPGEARAFRTPRAPLLLLPRLAERGLSATFRESADGTAVVLVERAERAGSLPRGAGTAEGRR